MPFWMQTEDPEYYMDKPFDPEDPYNDGDDEWENIDVEPFSPFETINS